jgi:hypothetical protein
MPFDVSMIIDGGQVAFNALITICFFLSFSSLVWPSHFLAKSISAKASLIFCRNSIFLFVTVFFHFFRAKSAISCSVASKVLTAL